PAGDTTTMSKCLAAPACLLQKRRISKQRKQPGYDRPQTDQQHELDRPVALALCRPGRHNPNLVRAIAWAKVKTDISSSGIHTSGRNPLAWSFASTAASIYITIQLPKV